MPAWGNTDASHNTKPKWVVEKETMETVQLYLYAGNTAGNTIISVAYNDGAQNNVANVGVSVGQYVYFWANGFSNNSGGQNGQGVPNMFASNTTVSSISGNTITITPALFGAVQAGWGIEFDKAIVYGGPGSPTGSANTKLSQKTYNADTILVTDTRLANGAYAVNGGSANLASGISANQVGSLNSGWVHIQKKVNNDGTVRYLKETLVALANPVASNTYSGNTSFGPFFTGT
jgi:hypothetical protein